MLELYKPLFCFFFFFKSISYIRTARYVSPCHWIMLFDQDISFDDRDTNLSLDTSRCFSYIQQPFYFIFFLCVNFYSGGGFKHSRMGSLIPASLWNISLWIMERYKAASKLKKKGKRKTVFLGRSNLLISRLFYIFRDCISLLVEKLPTVCAHLTFIESHEQV